MDKPVESWEPVFMEWLDLKVELVILKKSVDDEICTHTTPPIHPPLQSSFGGWASKFMTVHC